MHSFALVATITAYAAAMDLQASMAGQHCCTIYDSDYQMTDQYCLEYDSEQSTYALDTPIVNGFVKCGSRVDATVCPGEIIYGPLDGQRGLQYTCKSDSAEAEHGGKIGAGQAISNFGVRSRIATIILDLHPWVAKGAEYLSLGRYEKFDILWEKITENDEPAPEPSPDLFSTDMKGVFDDFGDELDCRHKTAHQIGNVGKVRWVDLGGHNYTGVFNGGSDTGFARLSSQFEFEAPNPRGSPGGGENTHFNPSIALKFLRDGVDSGNIMGNQGERGQSSHNFFEKSLRSHLKGIEEDVESRPDGLHIAQHIRPETGFIAGVGHSDFAEWRNDGIQVENPIFPFEIRYEPLGNIDFDDDFNEHVINQIKTIKPRTLLYAVYAKESPWSEEKLIAQIITESYLVTSNWGDEKMFFRHQRIDDDLRHRPDWTDHYVYFPTASEELLGFNDGAIPRTLHPYQQKTRSACPFSWIFE